MFPHRGGNAGIQSGQEATQVESDGVQGLIPLPEGELEMSRSDHAGGKNVQAGQGQGRFGVVLSKRGITDPESAQAFLKPSLSHLPDPFLLPDLEKAAERLIQALDRKERIVVYGDYDADGLTAAALMTDFLSGLGARISTYIPHRLEEGYGLNPGAVQDLAESGHTLIVTVDCGVSDFEGVSRACELGLDIHHTGDMFI